MVAVGTLHPYPCTLPHNAKSIVVLSRSTPRQVNVNGDKIGEFESQSGSTVTSLGIEEDDVHTITLESIGIGKNEWISLLEVSWLRPDRLFAYIL